jgi:hypothetical protein
MSGNIILATIRHLCAMLSHDFNLTEGRHLKTVSMDQGHYLLFRKEINLYHYVKEHYIVCYQQIGTEVK